MDTPKHHIYLDHSATTPVDPRVVEAMAPYWNEVFGNSESSHALGHANDEDDIARVLEVLPAIIERLRADE